MKLNIILHMNFKPSLRKLVLLSSFLVLLIASGCTSSYNSQKYWHRTPTSTGRNKCGCLLIPERNHAIKLYHQPTYVLQA